jgi:hypothetical protein
MSGLYGDFVANHVQQGSTRVPATSWTFLSANGSTNLAKRRQIRLMVRGKAGAALALAYVNVNADGTFTAPTTSIKYVTVYPGGAYCVEPLSDKVALYGKLIKKVTVTDNYVLVIVTEYQ